MIGLRAWQAPFSPLTAHLSLQLLCLLAFAALALAMPRPQQDLFGRDLSRAATLGWRTGGWALLGLALWLAVAALGWGYGLVVYSGHTSAAAALVFIALLASNDFQARRASRPRAARARPGNPPRKEL